MMGRAAVSGHRCESAATLAMKRRADHHHHADDEEADDANRAGVLGDLFTDVALCMFSKGDPTCGTEARDCFLDGDCLPLMHAMETTPPEPGNGLLEGETCFSRFDRLPLR